MLQLCYFISGIIIGFIFGSFSNMNKIKSKKLNEVKNLKRGIINRKYTSESPFEKSESVDVDIEIYEVECTNTKSKIKIIRDEKNNPSIIFSNSKFNTNQSKKKVIDFIDNSWVETNSIEWITDTLSTQREQKINKILK